MKKKKKNKLDFSCSWENCHLFTHSSKVSLFGLMWSAWKAMYFTQC